MMRSLGENVTTAEVDSMMKKIGAQTDLIHELYSHNYCIFSCISQFM